MLVTKRPPSVGHDRALRRRAARPVAEPVARDHHLPDDLARREIAHEALRAGVAERAGERAADLARHAQRRAPAIRDVDALDLVRPLACVFAGQPQQPFARAVDRNLLGDDLRPLQREALLERDAQVLRHAGHGGKARHAAHIDPVPELLHAHLALLFGHADVAERIGQRRARQADQRGLRRRHVTLQRGLFEHEAARRLFEDVVIDACVAHRCRNQCSDYRSAPPG